MHYFGGCSFPLCVRRVPRSAAGISTHMKTNTPYLSFAIIASVALCVTAGGEVLVYVSYTSQYSNLHLAKYALAALLGRPQSSAAPDSVAAPADTALPACTP